MHLSGTDTGPVATIKGTDSLSLDAGKNIDITGATVSSGGTLGMSAGNDINIAANLISGSKSQSGFWHTDDNSASSTTSQGSSISAGGNLAMAAGHNLDVTASSVSAGHSALLSAGNDLSLNAVRESKNSRNGRSESHESHAAVSTVTAGDNLLLVAGRDVASQAAGVAAENNVVIRGGRDVNLVAESAGAGDSYTSKKKKEINETVRQQGTEIASGGDTTVNAGRDITAVASSVTATGNISVNAGRDVALTTATESDYHYLETKKKSGGFLSKKTTHTISEDSASREAGSLLSGNRVTVNAGDNLTVEGSDVVADQDVSLAAGIQNKYAVLSAENRQKLHIDVAADPLTALSGEDKWNIEGGLSAAGRPGWLYGSLTNQEVKDYVAEGNSYDLNYLNSNTSKGDRALAFFGEPENYWGTVAGAGSLLTSSATLTEKFISAGLSYGANGAVQIGTGNIGDKFDYLSFMMSGLTGVGTAGKGYYANQLLGAGSAYMSSQIEGQDSTSSVMGSMAGTGLGYNIGASITNKLEAQYIKNQLGMDASKYSLQYSEKSIGYGMYQGGQMSSIPGTFGGFVGSFVSEGASSATQKEVDGDKK